MKREKFAYYPYQEHFGNINLEGFYGYDRVWKPLL